MRLLDWGCGETGIATNLLPSDGFELFACDVREEALASARTDSSSPVSTYLVDDLAPHVPLPDASIDAVLMLDVLEHMGEASRRAALAEAHRLLRPDGALVVTVPHAGLFGWADPENIKFRWPRFHRHVYTRIHGRQQYDRYYGSSERLGNYSDDASWHRHFDIAQLEAAVGDPFRLREVRYFAMVHPFVRAVLVLAGAISRRLGRSGGLLSSWLWKAYLWDADLVTGQRGYNMAASFRKAASVEEGGCGRRAPTAGRSAARAAAHRPPRAPAAPRASRARRPGPDP